MLSEETDATTANWLAPAARCSTASTPLTSSGIERAKGSASPLSVAVAPIGAPPSLSLFAFSSPPAITSRPRPIPKPLRDASSGWEAVLD